jgi:hypothetical protein
VRGDEGVQPRQHRAIGAGVEEARGDRRGGAVAEQRLDLRPSARRRSPASGRDGPTPMLRSRRPAMVTGSSPEIASASARCACAGSRA